VCFFPPEIKAQIAADVVFKMKDGISFTGYDVFKSITNLVDKLSAREVSSYVRELFNAGEMEGYASYQILPKQGPVLYFKVNRDKRTKLGQKINSILSSLHNPSNL
jgi:hypothetical protein